MTWRKFKKILVFIGLPAVILGLVVFSGLKLFRSYQAPVSRPGEPARIIEVKEPFSGVMHFNDQLGTDDFSNLLIANIDKASKTVEIAVYSMDSQEIKAALYRAANRGVAVSLIFSDNRKDVIDNLFRDKPGAIKIGFVSSATDGYMHHKFLLIDRGLDGQKLFFTSYNFTLIQGKYDPCFIMETGRPELVGVFGEEFDRLGAKITQTAKGIREKRSNNPFAALVKYPEGFLEIWFSPGSNESSIKDRMIGLIKNSASNIKILIWYMTDKEIAAELAGAAQRIPVSIVTDDFNQSVEASVFPALLAQKQRQHLDNLTIINDSKRNQEVEKFMPHQNFNSFLHQHLLLVDDKIALFGTDNWSTGGFFRNSESIMVTDIKSLVDAFEKSYQFNYDVNK